MFDGIVSSSYVAGGVRFTRETFASYPDQVIVTHLSANRKGTISFRAEMAGNGCDLSGRF